MGEVPLTLSGWSSADAAQVRDQLGRVPRGVVGVAARTHAGDVAVVATAPRLDDGSPFPTTFYLTHPHLVKLVSTLEATGAMSEYQRRLDDPDRARAYRDAHETYIRQRAEIGRIAGIAEVAEIAGISAGGMPERVKCLHALVAHALASGPGINPVGDDVLRRLAREGTWKQPGWSEEELS
ncbi:DUF501 domain-containing protein [Nanchangia anserum]|uniref:DUF501 domain-containing protein n=1 Tax=Nanchangia anserum TaxID=2692125 RepID=A0A8I0KP44_9ACTO|nr:DUF501 domain-containing protein [Nanchangia anserum]MBD3689976.1 DUF501 domain-containing protein [Nanchangia anserum]